MSQENETSLIQAVEAATAVIPEDKENLARVCSRLGKLKAATDQFARALQFANKEILTS